MAKKFWTYRPNGLPTRQCEGCGKFYHARNKECPNCSRANPTASSKTRVVKKRVLRRRNTRPAATPSEGDVWDAALVFIEQAGSLQDAQAMLDTIERIQM